jgi:membrane glycosyltransferase
MRIHNKIIELIKGINSVIGVNRMKNYLETVRSAIEVNGLQAFIKSVSRSGMTRKFDFFAIVADEQGNARLDRVNDEISALTGLRMCRKTRQIVREGVGMDFAWDTAERFENALGIERPAYEGPKVRTHVY